MEPALAVRAALGGKSGPTTHSRHAGCELGAPAVQQCAGLTQRNTQARRSSFANRTNVLASAIKRNRTSIERRGAGLIACATALRRSLTGRGWTGVVSHGECPVATEFHVNILSHNTDPLERLRLPQPGTQPNKAQLHKPPSSGLILGSRGYCSMVTNRALLARFLTS